MRGPEGFGSGKFLPGRGYLLWNEHHDCRDIVPPFLQKLWDTWVKLPVGDELKKVEEVFRRNGYLGAMTALTSSGLVDLLRRNASTPARRDTILSPWRRHVTIQVWEAFGLRQFYFLACRGI